MLVEAFRHLITPCPRHLRRMDYLKEAIGLRARYGRNRDAWAPHLGESRELIASAADMCAGGGRAVVIGSGLLLDIPLDVLCRRFADVVLVDILHMPEARKAVAKYPNVLFDQRDVTGIVEPLYRQVVDGVAADIPAVADLPLQGADLVVSSNILSQLPIRPSLFAGRAKIHSAQAMDTLARQVIEKHLDALAAFPGTVCLITETQHQWSDGETVVETSDPLLGVDIPGGLRLNSRKWTWDFAPHPERDRRLDLRFTVEGFMRPGIAGT